MFRTILRDLLAHSLPIERLQAYLPFQTTIRKGSDFVHIVNASVFSVETRYHVITERETLCGRRKQGMSEVAKGTEATCPGCTSIARGVIARNIVDRITANEAVSLADLLAHL